MKIVRGIIRCNNRNEMIVQSPGHIYHLDFESFFSQNLKENDKVLGIILNKKFCVCREFISNTGEFVFGYVTKKDTPGKQLSIQTIPGFEPNTFNPYMADYTTGVEVTVKIN